MGLQYTSSKNSGKENVIGKAIACIVMKDMEFSTFFLYISITPRVGIYGEPFVPKMFSMRRLSQSHAPIYMDLRGSN